MFGSKLAVSSFKLLQIKLSVNQIRKFSGDPTKFLYHSSGTWVLLNEATKTAKVGLANHKKRQLKGDMNVVGIKKTTQEAQQGDPILSVEVNNQIRKKTEVKQICAPVSGTVTQMNNVFAMRPKMLTEEVGITSLESHWLWQFDLSNTELEKERVQLTNYETYLQAKINRYDERISEILYLINEDKEPKEQHEPEMKELEEKLEQAEEELKEYKLLVQKWLDQNAKSKQQPAAPTQAQTPPPATA